MKTLAKITVCLVVFVTAVLFMGVSTQSGKVVSNPVKYPGQTQKNYFVTPTAVGGGDCLSWDSACTFRTAVSKLSSSFTTTIYLSSGVHDTDNVSDATGTTISTSYVHIAGAQPSTPSPVTRLVNKNAGATHVLRITGAYNFVSDIAFGQSDQTDKNVIMINLRANYQEVSTCSFTNTPGDGGGTGILIDNSAVGMFIHDNSFFGMVDSGIELGASTDHIIKNNEFYSGGKGIYASSGSADRATIEECDFLGLTTAIDYAAAATKTFYVLKTYFGNCTTNIADAASYGPTWFQDITESGMHRNTYPLTAGTSLSTGDGTWVWTAAAADIIPAATFAKPIKLRHINFQTWNAAQIYKIELLYGSASPANISLGIYEVVLGDPAAAAKVYTPMDLDIYIPARSCVGAKVMSSTSGTDTITVTLSYELL